MQKDFNQSGRSQAMIHVLLLAISWLFRCLTINHLLSLQSTAFDFRPECDNSSRTITMSVISTCDHRENPPPVHVSSRTGEASNKKQTDLVSGLFETAIQMISKDLRITSLPQRVWELQSRVSIRPKTQQRYASFWKESQKIASMSRSISSRFVASYAYGAIPMWIPQS